MTAVAVVTFQDAGEAARWLAAYTTPCYRDAYRALAPEFPRDAARDVDSGAIAREAVRVLAAQFAAPGTA